jgi:hypothetical protein
MGGLLGLIIGLLSNSHTSGFAIVPFYLCLIALPIYLSYHSQYIMYITITVGSIIGLAIVISL